MSRIVVRPASHDVHRSHGLSAGSALFGLAVGGGLLFLAREIWNAATEDAWVPGRPMPRSSSAPAIAAAKAALDTDPQLRDESLSLLPGGRGTIELHGWVADRQERSRAARLVAAAIAPTELINSLLVHGEDDDDSDSSWDEMEDDVVSA